MAKASQTLEADRLNELSDHFMQLHKSNHYKKTEMKEKDIVNKDDTIDMQYIRKLTYAKSTDTIRHQN